MKRKKTTEEKSKTRGLFDHINHIREVKSPDYYSSLTEEERKTFNKYMLLRILSMDHNIIEEISFISKYFQTVPNEQFYKLLIDIVPKGRKFNKYIKSNTEDVNKTILDCIVKKFQIGEKDAKDYYSVFVSSEMGIKDLVSLIEGFGFSEKEIENLFK